MVCGRVGSGKTSLAHAVLGLLRPAEGTSLAVSGRVAYVPQNAFVMNDTVRENIIFGGEFDQKRCNLRRAIHPRHILTSLRLYPRT